MATVGQISVLISADLAPLRKAQAEALKVMADINSAMEKSATQVDKAFGSSISKKSPFRDRAADIEAYGKELDKLQAKFNPIFSVESQHRQALEEINRALAVGAINQSEYTRALNVAESAFQDNLNSLKQGPPTLNQFSKGARSVGDSVKLSANQIQGMSYQFNDLLVQLASGQSAFTAITQQGAQIVQVFGPGTGVLAALKATGGALTSFLINPLNLSIVAIAAVAYAVPKIWNAVTGDDADAAKTNLVEFDQLVKNIGVSSDATAKALENIAKVRFSREDLSFQADISREGAQKQFALELENVAKQAREAGNWLVVAETAATDYGTGTAQADVQQRTLIQGMGDLAQRAKEGEISVQELRDGLRLVALDPQASEETRTLAKELFASTARAAELEAQAKSTTAAIVTMGQAFTVAMGGKGARGGQTETTVATELSNRIDPEKINKLVEDLKKQKNELEDVAGELGVAAVPTPERRPTLELGFSGDGVSNKRARAAGGSNKGEGDRDFLARLQSETTYLQQQLNLMSLTYDERVKATQQLQLEKNIRDAIVRLGEKATPAMKAAVTEQITLQQQLNAELKQQEAIQQVLSDASVEVGGLLGDALNGAITGTKDLKSSMLDLAVAIAKAALQAQLLESFGNGAGGLNATGGFLSALFGGLAGARADGGPVSQGKTYLVGERGPELFTANKSGVIVPNNKLGSGSIGGGSKSGGKQTSDVRVWVDQDGNWQAAVERIATDTSTSVTQQGISEYNRALPYRIKQYQQNPNLI